MNSISSFLILRDISSTYVLQKHFLSFDYILAEVHYAGASDSILVSFDPQFPQALFRDYLDLFWFDKNSSVHFCLQKRLTITISYYMNIYTTPGHESPLMRSNMAWNDTASRFSAAVHHNLLIRKNINKDF